MALRTTQEVIEQLENAIDIAKDDKEMARLIVIACKIAIQAQALDFAKVRFPIYENRHTLSDMQQAS